ncbi:unnamed protein product [Eretmochelys imbricata]
MITGQRRHLEEWMDTSTMAVHSFKALLDPLLLLDSQFLKEDCKQQELANLALNRVPEITGTPVLQLEKYREGQSQKNTQFSFPLEGDPSRGKEVCLFIFCCCSLLIYNEGLKSF